MIDMTHLVHAHAVLSAAPAHDRIDQDAFVVAVTPMWVEAFPWTGGELSDEDVRSGCIFDNVREHRAHQQAIADVLAKSPRGSWASMIQRLPTGDIFTDILIADGRGGYLLTSKHNAMSVAEARDRLVYKEISDARQSYRREQRVRESEVLMKANGWRVGTELKAAVIIGEVYKLVSIVEVCGDGSLVLSGQRRGTRVSEVILCMPHEIEVT